MEKTLQEGIFYNRNRRAGNSFALIFLRVSKASTAGEVGTALKELWKMYEDLKNGIQRDLKEIDEKRRYSGNLEVLIGYGSKIFSVNGCRRKSPSALEDYKNFREPFSRGGGPITEGSSVSYSSDITTNHVNFDHILIQFIGDDTLTVTRAIVETWKLLSMFRNKDDDYVLSISTCYQGFQRNDGRSWLGFHDGVSNIRSEDRLRAISISNKDLPAEDGWTINGTYLCFMRIEIDLFRWQSIDKELQELIIGRDKITGCPIVGKDIKGRPIKAPNCPIKGTSEVIERGNEIFRDYHTSEKVYSSMNSRNKELNSSHIARARLPPIGFRLENSQIYRQGFEFFETSTAFPGFRVGLNFISFQNNPDKLFKILQEGFSQNFQNNKESLSFEKFFTVRAAGNFIVPPKDENESFPGLSIFQETNARFSRSCELHTSKYRKF